MIAYNKTWIKNQERRSFCKNAFDEGLMNETELRAAYQRFPVGFYTPNFFIAVGLMLLTLIVVFFSFGILAVIFQDADFKTIGVLAVVTGIAFFVLLEKLISSRNYFRSGIDEGILWGATVLIYVGITLPHNFSGLTNSIIAFVIGIYGLLRYADRLIALLSYVAVIAAIFFLCLEVGAAGKIITPFAIMFFSLAAYFIFHKWRNTNRFALYQHCIVILESSAIIFLYASGNYFVVKEFNNTFFYAGLETGATMPLGWLFWMLTVVIPFIFLFRGIWKKDRLHTWIALLLIAAMIFTIRFYHAVLSAETAMTIAGIIIIGVSYLLTRYLHEPRYGFTSKKSSADNDMAKLNIEALIISETFSTGQADNKTGFGGGDFGGGGATGQY